MSALEFYNGSLVPFSAEGFPLVFMAGNLCICAECATLIAERVAHGLRALTVWQGKVACEACKVLVEAAEPDCDLEEEEEGGDLVWKRILFWQKSPGPALQGRKAPMLSNTGPRM